MAEQQVIEAVSVPRYEQFEEVPEHWQTKTRLHDDGLKPGGPIVGYYYAHGAREWRALYDRNIAVPRKQLTDEQLAARRAKAYERRKAAFFAELEAEWAAHEASREGAAAWARELLWAGNWAILDTETTGLSPGRIVQIAILHPGDVVALNSLVQPGEPIPPEATAIHGITDDQVAGAPTFAELYPQIVAATAGRHVVIYNAAFDRAFLFAECKRAGLPLLRRRYDYECAMEAYAAWINDWSEYHQSYRWYRLPGGDHTALGDCRATLDVLKEMAANMYRIPPEPR